MTTFSPGTGQRLKVLDLTSCYPAGTVLALTLNVYVSANWPGNTKRFDSYIITGSSLADLAAKEAAVDAGGTGYIRHNVFDGHVDSTAGAFLEDFATNSNASPLAHTSRYVSIYVKPQFNAVPWYTNDGSTLVLGANGVNGASTTACPVLAPVADFEGTPTSTEPGVALYFTDLSTNTPTSWAWDFGDGTTSTSQNPIKSGYASPGNYAVSLTATNAGGSDTETKTAYISVIATGTPDPPAPAGVLLEIYAADPGSARWDVAKWDEDSWGSGGWQDVTPYGVTVEITWGSNRPELGILSVPTAGNWAVDYYDPDRILDPANQDGPYYGDLRPYLPIRVSHRGVIVRVGYVTGISHNYAPVDNDGDSIGGTGYMRGTDNISRMANAMVPSDTELSDTLHLRALDAIAAAGLSIHVRPPRVTSPAVSPWITGTREWSVWDWIKDAAQEVLYIPFVDRYGNLDFRPWADPLVRARSLASPELIDLAVVTDYSGGFSVVQAREDEDTLVERALTPPPRYGARTYTRDEITIDPGAWAEAVLADRGLDTLLWKPGDVRPLTAVSTERLALIENVERVGLTLIEQTPPIIAAGIVVGGEIGIRGKVDDEAIWRFRYELAQTVTEPLIETGGEPTDYLLRTGGGEYLYPTGGA